MGHLTNFWPSPELNLLQNVTKMYDGAESENTR